MYNLEIEHISHYFMMSNAVAMSHYAKPICHCHVVVLPWPFFNNAGYIYHKLSRLLGKNKHYRS